eukprot:362581-Chlamydomonas_euryale.AAC.3
MDRGARPCTSLHSANGRFVLAVVPTHPGASWRKTDGPINARVLRILRIPGVLRSSYERSENVALLGCGWEAAGAHRIKSWDSEDSCA